MSVLLTKRSDHGCAHISAHVDMIWSLRFDSRGVGGGGGPRFPAKALPRADRAQVQRPTVEPWGFETHVMFRLHLERGHTNQVV